MRPRLNALFAFSVNSPSVSMVNFPCCVVVALASGDTDAVLIVDVPPIMLRHGQRHAVEQAVFLEQNFVPAGVALPC